MLKTHRLHLRAFATHASTRNVVTDCLAIVLFTSLVAKLIRPEEITLTLGAILGGGYSFMVREVLFFVLATEIVLASWLISGRYLTAGLIATVGFFASGLMMFAILESKQYVGGCGCGLSLPAVRGLSELQMGMIRNGGLIILAFLGLAFGGRAYVTHCDNKE